MTRELYWQFPRAENQPFELRAEGKGVGWLHFDDAFGARAVGELDGSRWIFDYHCAAHPHVSIVAAGSKATVAEFVPRVTGGGTVTFTSGASYCWNRARIWSPQWCICLTQQAGPLVEGGTVQVCQEAAQRPETAILVLLAWYLRVLAFETLVEAIPAVG